MHEGYDRDILVLIQQTVQGDLGMHYSCTFPIEVLSDPALGVLMPDGLTPTEFLKKINGTAPAEEFVMAEDEECVADALDAILRHAAKHPKFTKFEGCAIHVPCDAAVGLLCQTYYES
jgi:hypothetical protein